MFSPRAENFDMPGRPPAAPRSRWAKLPLRAICSDQSPATRARSESHLRAVRPLARRSALRRSNRSLVRVWAVDPPPAGASAVVGVAVVRGALEVVVAARVVVVGAVVVVVRPGRRAVPAAPAAGSRGRRSAPPTQPELRAPPPMALKERLRRRRLAPAEPISSRWAASTLVAQRTCSSQVLAGWTAAARPGLADSLPTAAIRADWAPARVDRRGSTLRAGRP